MVITSFYERKRRAAFKALTLMLPFLTITIVPYYLPASVNWIIASINALFVVIGLYIFAPRFLFRKREENQPKGNIDERTIMFARNELKPGTDRFDSYYKEFPSHKENDDNFRKLPGLLGKQSKFHNSLSFEATESIFTIVDGLHNYVEGKAKDHSLNLSQEECGRFIKSWADKSGVKSIGFTKMKDYHWYSVGGRGDRFGKKINQNHQIGIAFTVEMDHEMIHAAPKASIIMESATQYLNAGIIAVQLAQFIRNCGFDARAHIDGNYQIVAPLVARDANLGEIGRMGLLMTPELGPRVRVGVVTTNMPLPVVERHYDDSYEDFCTRCLKCAVNCPASAISGRNAQLINGVNRWQIDSEKCFNYWCIAGTDCGRCMSTCPYSHPNNLMHKMVRWCIRQFPNFRYWAVKMDDFFYGRKASPGKLPDWLMTKTDTKI